MFKSPFSNHPKLTICHFSNLLKIYSLSFSPYLTFFLLVDLSVESALWGGEERREGWMDGWIDKGEKLYAKLNDTVPDSKELPELTYTLILLHPYLISTLG